MCRNNVIIEIKGLAWLNNNKKDKHVVVVIGEQMIN